MKAKKSLAVVHGRYQDDGWYGKRYRYILFADSNQTGFTTVTEARKLSSKFKKHLLERDFNKSEYNGLEIMDIQDMNDSQTIHTIGPSFHWYHINYYFDGNEFLRISK